MASFPEKTEHLIELYEAARHDGRLNTPNGRRFHDDLQARIAAMPIPRVVKHGKVQYRTENGKLIRHDTGLDRRPIDGTKARKLMFEPAARGLAMPPDDVAWHLGHTGVWTEDYEALDGREGTGDLYRNHQYREM